MPTLDLSKFTLAKNNTINSLVLMAGVVWVVYNHIAGQGVHPFTLTGHSWRTAGRQAMQQRTQSEFLIVSPLPFACRLN